MISLLLKNLTEQLELLKRKTDWPLWVNKGMLQNFSKYVSIVILYYFYCGLRDELTCLLCDCMMDTL